MVPCVGGGRGRKYLWWWLSNLPLSRLRITFLSFIPKYPRAFLSRGKKLNSLGNSRLFFPPSLYLFHLLPPPPPPHSQGRPHPSREFKFLLRLRWCRRRREKKGGRASLPRSGLTLFAFPPRAFGKVSLSSYTVNRKKV